MSFIALSDTLMNNVTLGNAQVTGIWLGDKFIWPTDVFDDGNLLLEEFKRGIRGYTGGERETGEHLIQIDRKVWENEGGEWISIVTDGEEDILQYEENNQYPFEIAISRDYIPLHDDGNNLMATHDGEDSYISVVYPQKKMFDNAILGFDTND